MSALVQRLQGLLVSKPGNEAHIKRIKRRRAIFALIGRSLPYLRVALYLIGYLWVLLIPLEQLGRGTYIDENALQPGQVNTYWDWKDVHAADMYLEHLEGLRDRNASSSERAEYLRREFEMLGIPCDTQAYSFSTSLGDMQGTNAYAIHSSPRTSGAEAIVVSASWLSRTGEGDGTLNLRGVATVLALAGFLKRYSLWAKDLVFVISDGYLDGMQAFLNAYHGVSQSNLVTDALTLDSGVIWTALALDYPGHSFSHIGIFFEGLNGRLPNQDLLNSAQLISRWTAHIPVILYDHLDELRGDLPFAWAPSPLRNLLNSRALKEWEYRGKNVLRQMGYQAGMRASGIHGLFHQFRIDAITLFALPADGPHGFHSLGRLTESLLRTMNNLLERLHASFFFYMLTSPSSFVKIGNYLPAAILVGVGCMFGGMRGWVSAGCTEVGHEKGAKVWRRRGRRTIEALGIVLAAHVWGGVVFLIATSRWFAGNLKSPTPVFYLLIAAVSVVLPLLAFRSLPGALAKSTLPLAPLLHSILLLELSLILTSLPLLNFPLSFTFALLAFPLSIVRPSAGWIPALSLCLVSPARLMLSAASREFVARAVQEWEVLGVGILPLAWAVWAPLVWIGQAVCVLPE